MPQSLQKPLKALESRGNPYGKMEKKKADWANAKEFQQVCQVKILGKSNGADTLYFVDSITSYDDRMQSIGRATAKILDHVGENFGILALRKEIVAMKCGGSGKSCSSPPCAITMWTRSRHPG